jgi:hypothetical protein
MSAFFAFLGAYDAFLIVFGSVGNSLIFLVCMRIKNNTTFNFLRFLAVSDFASLFFWNLNGVMIGLFDRNLFDTSIEFCKLSCFMQYATLLISAWILVSLSFDRYFSMAWANWKTLYLRPHRANFLCAAMVVFFVLINVHVFFTVGQSSQLVVNGTILLSECDGTFKVELYRIWSWVCIFESIYTKKTKKKTEKILFIS